MIAVAIRYILAGAWKPILAILGALGLYAKGRADANAKAKQRDLEAHAETVEDVLNETVSADPVDDVRRRMSERAK